MHGDAASFDAILKAVVFLGATSLFIPAFRRVGLSAVMAFLVIGVLVGPHGAGRLAEDAPWLSPFVFENSAETQALAEFGVVFLLFVIGLEVSSARLWALRRYVLGLGLSQVCLSAGVIALVALAFGHGPTVAVVTGLALALSSTAVVLQLLGERRQMAGPVGRSGFSVLLLQDVAVVPILFVVSALSVDASHGGGGGLHGLGLALGAAMAAIMGILVGGRLIIRPLFRWAASVDGREVFLATALLVVIGAAAAAQALGLSMALGAFLAGLLLAETEFRHGIETDVEPFKGLLLGLFFVTVGMQIDLGMIAAMPVNILIGVVGLFAVKIAIIAPLARLFGLSWGKSFELGFLLGQAGEFAFVIIALAREGGAYPAEVADYMLAVVALALFLTPLVATIGRMLGQRLDRARDEPVQAEANVGGHVIVAGYGRVGQALGEVLQSQEVAHVAVDTDADLVVGLRAKGWPIHFGDASRREVLAAMGAERAGAIVVTMDNFNAVERVVDTVRAAWPGVPVYARARDAAQARALHAKGATLASPETTEATLQLGEALLGGLGFPDEAARRIINERREAEFAKTIVGR